MENELNDERRENEILTINEIKSLEKAIIEDKLDVANNFLGTIFGMGLTTIVAMASSLPVRYSLLGVGLFVAGWVVAGDISLVIERIKNNKIIIEEKQEEVEELRRR